MEEKDETRIKTLVGIATPAKEQTLLGSLSISGQESPTKRNRKPTR